VLFNFCLKTNGSDAHDCTLNASDYNALHHSRWGYSKRILRRAHRCELASIRRPTGRVVLRLVMAATLPIFY